MSAARARKGCAGMEQLTLDWREWGGARAGAGRKKTRRSRVAHRRRRELRKYEPLHVTAKCLPGLPSLRARGTAPEVMRKLSASAERAGFRLVHFSVQRDHLHLIVEVDDRRSLTSGVRSLLTA